MHPKSWILAKKIFDLFFFFFMSGFTPYYDEEIMHVYTLFNKPNSVSGH